VKPIAIWMIALTTAVSGVAAAALACAIAASATAATAPASAALQLVSNIPLGRVHGRIDHLAVDLAHRRLFVSELGNDSLGIIDLAHGTVRTITGLREPQGIGYVAATDTVYVANAGDGSVRLFRGPGLTPAGEIALGDDADDVRVDAADHRLYVGYGSGALAVIDTTRAAKIADIPLGAHPEGFELERSGTRILVNVPNAAEIAIIDRVDHRQVARWTTGPLRANFPMALDPSRGRVLVVFRRPARLGVFRASDGRLLGSVDTCHDADDVFLDVRRLRAYVICGEGVIDVLAASGDGYRELGRIRTSPGARTGLFVPQLNELLVAVRATLGTPAGVWAYQAR